MIIKHEIPPYVAPKSFVALDVELFNAEKKHLHRPTTGSFAALSVCCEDDLDTVFVITNEDDVSKTLERVNDGVLVFHNAQFDITHLRRWSHIPPRNTVWCTMLIEQILYGGYYSNFPSLEDLVRRYVSVKLSKDVRETFGNVSTIDLDQINYVALDAFWTIRMALEQRKIMKEQNRMDAWHIWKDVDLPALWAFLDFRGFRIDIDAWKTLAKENQQKANEIEAEFNFNPRSPQQVKTNINKLGWSIASTGAKILEQAIQNDPESPGAKLAATLLEYRKYHTRVSRYGNSFIEDYLESEQCNNELIFTISASNNVIGAETGRTSVSKPSMQNLPTRDTKEFRKPWIARPRHKLIIADYSAQEPRVHAYLSKDAQLKEIFISGRDPYIELAKVLYNKEINKSDPLRNRMKISFLGATYGQSPQGVAKAWNISLSDAIDLQNKFFAKFPGSKRWVDQQKKKSDYVETVLGRRIWLNCWNNQSERNALNAPHQGSSADMMKQAIGKMHENWTFNCPFGVVAQVHDEVILDVPEELSSEIKDFVRSTMIQVAEKMCPGIPFKVEAIIANNWSEK